MAIFRRIFPGCWLGITKIDQPAQYPDCNPIEYLWEMGPASNNMENLPSPIIYMYISYKFELVKNYSERIWLVIRVHLHIFTDMQRELSNWILSWDEALVRTSV